MSSELEIHVEDVDGLENTKLINIGCELNETNAQKFMDHFNELIDQGLKNFIVDIVNSVNINSIGLGILLNCHFLAQEQQGFFKMANLNKDVMYVVNLLGVHKILEIYPTIEEAVASIKK